MSRPGGARYLVRRFLAIFPITILASLVLFALLNLLPGDAALSILSDTPHTEAMRNALRTELGLDDPWWTRYARWISGAINGRGASLVTDEPVRSIIGRQLPITLLLASYTTILGVVVAVPLGVFAAQKRGTWVDRIIRVVTIGGVSMPPVWSSLLVLLVLVKLIGWSPPIIYSGIFEAPGEHLAIMIWPVIILGWQFGSRLVWVTRASVSEAISRQFVVAARARGIREGRVVFRYGLRNALLPPITAIGLHFGALLGGAVVLETVFGLPGLGLGIVDSGLARDLPVILTQASIIVLIHQLLNFGVDGFYLLVDPRIGGD